MAIFVHYCVQQWRQKCFSSEFSHLCDLHQNGYWN
jgi:hypothetical protein